MHDFRLKCWTKTGEGMILATIRVMVPARKNYEALRILRSVAKQTKVLPGCLACQVYRSGEEDNCLMLEQLWDTEGNLERHLQSDQYQKVLLVMEMAIKKPEIRFDTISVSTGIETIEKARRPIREEETL